jgi:hypothetical protein
MISLLYEKVISRRWYFRKEGQMKKIVFAFIVALTPSAVIAQAETGQIATPIATPQSANAVLRVGTPVPMKLSQRLTTEHKQLRVGQRVRLETSEAVVINGITVIPIGTPGIGEVTEVRNKGMWGRSGHFSVQILYLTSNGRQIRLSGVFDEKGTAGGIGATAAAAVLLPIGFLVTGTSADLPLGTPVTAFIDEDVPLAIALQQPTPLQIPAQDLPPTPVQNGP